MVIELATYRLSAGAQEARSLTRPEHDDAVLDFPWALPGFPNLKRFAVGIHSDVQPATWLRSLDDPEVVLPLVDPWAYFPSYAPELPPYARACLGLESLSEATVYAVIVPHDRPGPTINLFAPIVINRATRVGRQVMLEHPHYAVHTPMAAVRRQEAPLG